MRASQIKEQLEAIGNTVEEVELVMTTLNGLPKSWESFIQAICSRRKLTKFSRLWEDCTQEEARLETREENLGDDENKALATHAGKGKSRKEVHPPRKFQVTTDTKYSKRLIKLQMLQLPKDGTHC